MDSNTGAQLSKMDCCWRRKQADKQVITYFAYIHDCMRENEGHDPEHGPRAVKFIKQNRYLVDLDDSQFKILCNAVAGHTFGKKSLNPTIATCWDADRLDLTRVGIRPDPDRLLTDAGKRRAIDIGPFTNSPFFQEKTYDHPTFKNMER